MDTSQGNQPITSRHVSAGFVNIPGATSNFLFINPTTPLLNGNMYRVVYRGLAGVVGISNVATLQLSLASQNSGGAAGSGSSASGDPHIVGADGRQFSFDGVVGNVYNLVSNEAVQVNTLIGVVPHTKYLNLDGEWMVTIGIQLASGDTIVIDVGRPIDGIDASIVLNGELLVPSQQPGGRHEIFLEPIDSETSVRLEVQEYSPRVPAFTLGIPSTDPVVRRVRLTISKHLELQVLMVEQGYSEATRQWLTPFARRWLDLSVRSLVESSSTEAVASSHGILGQTLAASSRLTNSEAKQRGVSSMTVARANKESQSWPIEGSEADYRESSGDVLGSSFAFNRFRPTSTVSRKRSN